MKEALLAASGLVTKCKKRNIGPGILGNFRKNILSGKAPVSLSEKTRCIQRQELDSGEAQILQYGSISFGKPRLGQHATTCSTYVNYTEYYLI